MENEQKKVKIKVQSYDIIYKDENDKLNSKKIITDIIMTNKELAKHANVKKIIGKTREYITLEINQNLFQTILQQNNKQ